MPRTKGPKIADKPGQFTTEVFKTKKQSEENGYFNGLTEGLKLGYERAEKRIKKSLFNWFLFLAVFFSIGGFALGLLI